ncbi:MAG TPA: hypothetical protein GX012_02185 [Acholeplasma sp.]|nr:hypothetical protein [Acholeplasma sp.]
MNKIYKYVSALYFSCALVTILILLNLSKKDKIDPIFISKLSMILWGVYIFASIILFIIDLIIKKKNNK